MGGRICLLGSFGKEVLVSDGTSERNKSSFGIRDEGLGEAISPKLDFGKAMSYLGDIGREAAGLFKTLELGVKFSLVTGKGRE